MYNSNLPANCLFIVFVISPSVPTSKQFKAKAYSFTLTVRLTLQKISCNTNVHYYNFNVYSCLPNMPHAENNQKREP